MPRLTSDIALNPHPSIMVIGDSGTHKTFFAGSCPKPYIFSFDGGESILRHNKVAQYDIYKDAPYGKAVDDKMKERGFYQWGTAWEIFVGRLDKIGQLMDQGQCPYETLVLDSLTTLSDICLNYVKKANGKAPLDQVTLPEWGSQIALLQKVMDELTAWPIMLVVTAHIQRDKNGLTETTEMLPLVTGKLAGKIGLYFDEVYYAKSGIVKEQGKPERQAFWFTTSGNTMEKQAKSRYGVPNNTPASWKAIEPYITGQKTSAQWAE